MSTDSTEIIEYDYFASQFGRGIIAANASGICDIVFSAASDVELVSNLGRQNHGWQVVHAPGRFAEICTDMFSPDLSNCELDMDGSAFQIEVWSALRRIPFGQTISYQQLAQRLGHPRVARIGGERPASRRCSPGSAVRQKSRSRRVELTH